MNRVARIDLTRQQARALYDWHVEKAREYGAEGDYIEAQYHTEQAERFSDDEVLDRGSLRELAELLLLTARNHESYSQAIGIVGGCSDHLRALACCLEAVRKEHGDQAV